MSRREKPGSTDTAFGPVNPRILEALQESFDTQQLLELVDRLDELRARIDSSLRPRGCSRWLSAIVQAD
jgi:hypothetical protein